ncbi:MAG: hypothetical protein NUV42_02650 [Candidatus Yonathbacteria bacterium]|nr:hypothetical protein [Candidatus Yonathbacteria bacterium]
MPNKRVVKILLSVILCAIFAIPAFAQITSSEDLNVQATPETPGPFETVVLDLSSYRVDVDRLHISWYVNDKLELAGIGKKKFSFTTKGVGSSSTVRVLVRSGTAGTLTKTLVFSPTDIDILWEALGSYTPPFYRGKALAIPETTLAVVAIPNMMTPGGSAVGIKDVVYKWKKNSSYADFYDQSGYGNNYVFFKKNPGNKTDTIAVEASSFDGRLTAFKNLHIPSYDPKVILYEHHPLEGIRYERAIDGAFAMQNKEVLISAEPYFFSTKDKDGGNVSYEWLLDNKQVTDTESDKKSELALRTEGGSGKALVLLRVKHTTKIFQFFEQSFTVNFGETSGTSFGF